MTTKELKQKYFDYFVSKGHQLIDGASLIPENDPSVLFTTAGMHPLVPYLMGEKHPSGNKLVDVQKCIRTGDIDEVGDDWHLTFFEMLGNWSLGDPKEPDGVGAGYFKTEAIKMSFEFLTKELEIPVEKLAVTCFAGDDDAPKDEETVKVWQAVGIAKERIAYLGKDDNWWPAGGKMPGPQGPDTEMFYFTGTDEAPKEFNPTDKRWVEIWNDVFMQYSKADDGSYQELIQKNVDTGMGLERTVAILNNQKSVYETEKLYNILLQIASLADINISNEMSADIDKNQERMMRIVADHLRAATFILAEGVEPSNIERGYVLRRLIRRSIRFGSQLGISESFTHKVVEVVIAEHGGFYRQLREKRDFITDQIIKEEEKFSKTLEKGLARFEKLAKADISGIDAFNLFATYGFPIEMTQDLAGEHNIKVDRTGFDQEFKKHQNISRQGAEKKFKGGLADDSKETARLHTAAHLLLAALRQVIGDQVFQKGSNITSERLRFDFSHSEKLTNNEKQKVENLVNEQIIKKIPVTCEELTLDEAKAQGAMGVFESKYGDKVKVYTVEGFSKEICGGPHATNTGELGQFKIQKEESSSAGVRRIKAILQ